MALNLTKNQTINLSKQASQGLTTLKFGVNWGKITTKSGGFFGIGSRTVKEDVDLDASATTFQSSGVLDTVYYGKLRNSFITHSGDDRVGDCSQDDSDNETITVDFTRVPNNVDRIYLYVNSFTGQTFDSLPYTGVRVYEGATNRPTNTIAKFEVANDSSFKGVKTMVLGYCEKVNGGWEFKSKGDAVRGISSIRETVAFIANNY